MQTECPHCHTVFHVQEDEFEQADGQLRCGHCLAVFTADNPYKLIDYPPTTESIDTDTSPELNNDTVSTAEDEVETIQDDENDRETEHESGQNLTLNFAMGSDLGLDLTPDEEDKEAVVADVIPPELRAESRQPKPHISLIGTGILTICILAGIAVGVFQYAYYNRDTLLKVSGLRPWLELTCGIVGCTLPAPKDLSLIVLGSKNIFTHPNTENALMVSASIVNQASFEQIYPVIELRFENVRGESIAARRFHAVEYLGVPEGQISKMQPETPVSISLEIKDPGSEMVSYKFDFL